MKKTLLLLAIIISGGLLTSCGSHTSETAISFKGGTITENEVYDSLKKIQGADSAVQEMIVFQIFENKYGDKVTSKEINTKYNDTKKQFGDSFEAKLKASGYTEKEYKENIKKSLAFQKGKKAHLKLTDKDLEMAWKTFHPEVEAQIIQTTNEKDAKAVKKSADSGEDFSKLVKEKSTDTATKEDNGKIKFDSTTTSLPSEVKEAAFKLKNNGISDVIPVTNTSTYQPEYYVVKMIKNKDKGNDMDKYKKQLKGIATEIKLDDNTFKTKVITEELKAADVKIKDKDFKDVLKVFTENTSSKSSSESEK